MQPFLYHIQIEMKMKYILSNLYEQVVEQKYCYDLDVDIGKVLECWNVLQNFLIILLCLYSRFPNRSG